MKFETHGYHFLFDQTALSPGNLAQHHAPLKTVTKKIKSFTFSLKLYSIQGRSAIRTCASVCLNFTSPSNLLGFRNRCFITE